MIKCILWLIRLILIDKHTFWFNGAYLGLIRIFRLNYTQSHLISLCVYEYFVKLEGIN